MRISARRPAAALLLPLFLLAAAGCDIVTADLDHAATEDWRRTYELQPGGAVEISNVNGRITVEPSTGRAVEVVARKTAKAASDAAAKDALGRLEIIENSSTSGIKIETKVPRGGGGLFGPSASVEYTVRVPSGGRLTFTTVNGGVELRGISGDIRAETTNGGIEARNVGGSIEASTTNGRVDVEVAALGEDGVRLECTNGGISLRLPADARASISARTTNGGIDTSGLDLDTTESTERRLEASLNGGGPVVRLSGTNGGIRISASAPEPSGTR